MAWLAGGPLDRRTVDDASPQGFLPCIDDSGSHDPGLLANDRGQARAAEEPQWRHATALTGEPRYGADAPTSTT
ncbi:hypothetical protein [Pannonibacter phragmitetus]|uniref:hypothetical protein n=1 Tax=Pannonibacter phragmitetus TaxID=121719 RepID=UPI003D2F43F0